MPHYRENEVYKILEEILTNAGMRIYYQNVPDDSIDGAIWARSDEDSASIMMPIEDVFPDAETACLILGHEAGHILANVDSPDVPSIRRKNEAICDLIGCCLYELAGRTYELKMEQIFQQ